MRKIHSLAAVAAMLGLSIPGQVQPVRQTAEPKQPKRYHKEKSVLENNRAIAEAQAKRARKAQKRIQENN
jgi:hypothetical protein